MHGSKLPIATLQHILHRVCVYRRQASQKTLAQQSTQIPVAAQGDQLERQLHTCQGLFCLHLLPPAKQPCREQVVLSSWRRASSTSTDVLKLGFDLWRRVVSPCTARPGNQALHAFTVWTSLLLRCRWHGKAYRQEHEAPAAGADCHYSCGPMSHAA